MDVKFSELIRLIRKHSEDLQYTTMIKYNIIKTYVDYEVMSKRTDSIGSFKHRTTPEIPSHLKTLYLTYESRTLTSCLYLPWTRNHLISSFYF